MLSLETPPIRIGDLLVLPDHAVPGAFYYAAPNPRLSRTDGRPMLDLVSYAVELEHSPLAGTTIPAELGAGFLTLGVDCALDAATVDRTRETLAERTGLPPEQVSLSPIPYTRGTVSLIALDAGAAPPDGRPRLAETVVGGGTPSLLGDLRSIFSVSLSRQGVEFLQGLFREGAVPIGVVYDLTFLGLRPAVQAEVTADLARVHTELSARLGLSYQSFHAEIEGVLTKLQETSAIQVRLTSQATGDAAAKSRELALSLFRDRIVQEFFKPTAVPRGSAPIVDLNQLRPISLTLKAKRSEELKRVTYTFDERSPEERTHAPQGFLDTLVSRGELAGRITHVDLGSPFFELLEVLVSGPTDEEFDALGLRSVTAELAYGTARDRIDSETLVFRRGQSGDKVFAVKRRGRPSLAYTATLTYEFSRDAGTDADALTYTVGPTVHTGRTLSVRPYDDVGVLDVEVEAGRIEESVRQVDVDLSYVDGDFTATHHVRLTAGDRRWQVRTRRQGARSYSATPTFTFDDGATYTGEPVTTGESLLRVDSPFRATRTLLVQPNVRTADVSRITVEVDYADGAYRRRFAVTCLPDPATGAWTPGTLAWPILDADRQALRYRVTTAAAGIVETTDWLDSDEPSLLVGDTAGRLRSLTVRTVGPALADAGLDAVEVRVTLPGEPEDGAASLFFDPTTPAVQTVQLSAGTGTPPGFRYQVVAYRSDGTRHAGAWQTAPTSLVVVQTRAL